MPEEVARTYSHPSPDVSRLAARLRALGIQAGAASEGTPEAGYTLTVFLPPATTEEQIALVDAEVPLHHLERLPDVVQRVKVAIADEKQRRRSLGFSYTGVSYLTGGPVTTKFSLTPAAVENYQRVLASPSVAGPFPTVWLNQEDTDGILLADEAAVVTFAEAAFQAGAAVVKQAGAYTAQLLAAPDAPTCEALLQAYLAEV